MVLQRTICECNCRLGELLVTRATHDFIMIEPPALWKNNGNDFVGAVVGSIEDGMLHASRTAPLVKPLSSLEPSDLNFSIMGTGKGSLVPQCALPKKDLLYLAGKPGVPHHRSEEHAKHATAGPLR